MLAPNLIKRCFKPNEGAEQLNLRTILLTSLTVASVAFSVLSLGAAGPAHALDREASVPDVNATRSSLNVRLTDPAPDVSFAAARARATVDVSIDAATVDKWSCSTTSQTITHSATRLPTTTTRSHSTP